MVAITRQVPATKKDNHFLFSWMVREKEIQLPFPREKKHRWRLADGAVNLELQRPKNERGREHNWSAIQIGNAFLHLWHLPLILVDWKCACPFCLKICTSAGVGCHRKGLASNTFYCPLSVVELVLIWCCTVESKPHINLLRKECSNQSSEKRWHQWRNPLYINPSSRTWRINKQ